MNKHDIDKALKSLLEEKKREKPTGLLDDDDDKIISILDEVVNKRK